MVYWQEVKLLDSYQLERKKKNMEIFTGLRGIIFFFFYRWFKKIYIVSNDIISRLYWNWFSYILGYMKYNWKWYFKMMSNQNLLDKRVCLNNKKRERKKKHNLILIHDKLDIEDSHQKLIFHIHAVLSE